MKNTIRIFSVILAFIALPFLAKAQLGGGGSTLPQLTINYVDNGYGPLTATATTTLHNPEFTQVISPSGSYTYYGYSVTTRGLAWQYLTISAAGVTESGISIADLELQTISVPYGFHYVPKSPSGTAPVYTITRNSPYNYTITSWLIPL